MLGRGWAVAMGKRRENMGIWHCEYKRLITTYGMVNNLQIPNEKKFLFRVLICGKCEAFRANGMRVIDRPPFSPDSKHKPNKAMPNLSSMQVIQRREQFIASWRQYAPEAAFAGFTLDQFEAESTKPLEVRSRMREARTTLAGLKLERDKTDETYMQMLVAVANGIRADLQNFGPDSPLYRSLGFIPRSERKRPRTRQAGTAPIVEESPTPPTGSADAA